MTPPSVTFFSFHTFFFLFLAHAPRERDVDPLDHFLDTSSFFPLVLLLTTDDLRNHDTFFNRVLPRTRFASPCAGVCVCVFSRGVYYRPSEPGGIILSDNSTHSADTGRILA